MGISLTDNFITVHGDTKQQNYLQGIHFSQVFFLTKEGDRWRRESESGLEQRVKREDKRGGEEKDM